MLYRIIAFLFAVSVMGCTPNANDSEQTGSFSTQPSVSDTLEQSLEYANARADSSTGQTIYVPVYSHIYQQNQRTTFNLTATLSFRNADLNRSMQLTEVLYYDSDGNLVKSFVDEPLTLKPLASTSFVIEEDDLRGGVGANFIVKWQASEPLFPPVVEAVMISTTQQQGISFVSHGRVLEEAVSTPPE